MGQALAAKDHWSRDIDRVAGGAVCLENRLSRHGNNALHLGVIHGRGLVPWQRSILLGTGTPAQARAWIRSRPSPRAAIVIVVSDLIHNAIAVHIGFHPQIIS